MALIVSESMERIFASYSGSVTSGRSTCAISGFRNSSSPVCSRPADGFVACFFSADTLRPLSVPPLVFGFFSFIFCFLPRRGRIVVLVRLFLSPPQLAPRLFRARAQAGSRPPRVLVKTVRPRRLFSSRGILTPTRGMPRRRRVCSLPLPLLPVYEKTVRGESPPRTCRNRNDTGIFADCKNSGAPQSLSCRFR